MELISACKRQSQAAGFTWWPWGSTAQFSCSAQQARASLLVLSIFDHQAQTTTDCMFLTFFSQKTPQIFVILGVNAV